MSKRLDLAGQQFGELTVVEYTRTRNGKAEWLCQCSCGQEIIVAGQHLRLGKIQSCSECQED